MNAKRYETIANVGKVRHVVSFHDGVKAHPDGSPFFDIATFGNKRARDKFCRSLIRQGYAGERPT